MATEKRHDLIDRNELLAEYDRVHIGEPGKARKLMEDAPTVDAVEVVRCFECQKEGTEECPMAFRDCLTGCLCANTKGTDFCSYGERRTT